MGSILKLQADFSKEVEELCQKRPKESVIDVIMELCEKYGIEPESVGRLVSKPVKERLRVEFESRNMIKGGKRPRLPLD